MCNLQARAMRAELCHLARLMRILFLIFQALLFFWISSFVSQKVFRVLLKEEMFFEGVCSNKKMCLSGIGLAFVEG